MQKIDPVTENESILVKEEGSDVGDLIQSDPRNQIKRQILKKSVNVDELFSEFCKIAESLTRMIPKNSAKI